MKPGLLPFESQICHTTGGDLSHDRRKRAKLKQRNAIISKYLWWFVTFWLSDILIKRIAGSVLDGRSCLPREEAACIGET